MRRVPRWAWWLIGVVAVLALLRFTVFRPRPLEVEVARVERGLVEDVVTNSQAGAVRSRQRARLGVEATGKVASIPHREGSQVRAGTVLLELDRAMAAHQLELSRRERDAATAALASTRATSTLARREFERIETLFRDKVVSQGEMDAARSRLDTADAGFEAARAQVERAEAAVALAAESLDHMRVVAPFAGVVSQRFVEVGEPVVIGQPVLELMSLDSLYVSAPIDEIDIARLRSGLPARVTLDPWPGVVWQGALRRVAPYIDDVKAQNRTLEVEVDLPPDPSKPAPKPGASADVEIVLRNEADALRVPTFAVLENRRVLVVERGRAVSRDVTIGLRNWNWTEIRSGLGEGETVITSLDKSGLRDGTPVKTVPRRAGADSTSSPPRGA